MYAQRFLQFVLAFWCITCCYSLSFDEFVTVTSSQKEKLDELRSRLKDKLPHNYMQKDIYLLVFLRDSDFNVDLTEETMLSFLEWRERNGIDSILLEDFPEYDDEYRVTWEGCDRGGNPVIALPVGDWDFRRVVISGKRKRFVRYVQKAIEEGTSLLRWGQEEGFNMTQATILFDLKGISLATHGCAGCLQMYLDLLGFAQKYYLGYVHKIHVVYIPEILLSATPGRRTYSSETARLIDFHGTRTSEIAKRLQRDIPLTQLSKRYGGLKKEGLDLSTLRSSAPKGFLANPFSLNLKSRNITDFCSLDWNVIKKVFAEEFPANL